jgi:hypothetical protein
MGITDIGEFKSYGMTRFKGILDLTVRNSLKTQSPDETPVDVQMHDGRGKNHQAYLGNTAGRPDRWSSTFEWVANEKDLNGSWATSRASSNVMVTGPTIMSGELESSTQRVGCTPGASSSKRSNSIPEIKLRL